MFISYNVSVYDKLEMKDSHSVLDTYILVRFSFLILVKHNGYNMNLASALDIFLTCLQEKIDNR